MLTSKSPSYTTLAQLFHWLTVPLLMVQYLIGWLMPDVHRDTQPVGLIAWHLSLGALILLLIQLRMLWRIAHQPPAESAPRSPGLRATAQATHGLLYLLLIAVPLMGWANASSRGWSVALFGVTLPSLSEKGSRIGHALGDIHQLSAWILVAAVALHVAAALYHHFILKDDTLRRIVPRPYSEK